MKAKQIWHSHSSSAPVCMRQLAPTQSVLHSRRLASMELVCHTAFHQGTPMWEGGEEVGRREGRGKGKGERRGRGEGEGEGREEGERGGEGKGRERGERERGGGREYFTNLDYRSKAIDFLTIYVASLPSHPLHPHLRDITRRAHSWFPWRPSRSLEKDGQFVAQALLRPNSLPEIHIVMHLQREDREETTASVGR